VRASLIYITMALMLSCVCALDLSVESARPPAPKEESAVYALVGEFRAVAANLLWTKAEIYHHEYIAHGGTWNENKDLMPLIRLIVDLDPRFVEAYLTGAWMLATGLGRPEQAVRFLREGIANNPTSPELYEELGTLYARPLGDPRRGLRYLEKALQLTQDEFDRQRLSRLVGTVRRICREQDLSARAVGS